MNLTDKSGDTTLSGLMDILRSAEDWSSTSLWQYTKKSTINSRVFIEQNLAGEDIVTDLMLNIQNLYVGLILTALDMNRAISSTKRIRDLMGVVSTEALEIAPVDLKARMDEYFAGSANKRVSTMGIVDNIKRSIGEVQTIAEDETGTYWEKDKNISSYGSTSARTIDNSIKDMNLPSGRIIELKMNPEGKQGKELTVHMLLQLLPRFIPTEVAQAFVSLNFTPSLKQRWMQRSAGEISFFKDFLMNFDMNRAKKKAQLADKTGILQEMLDKQKNSMFKMWMKRALITPEKQNIANTILIFNKRSFDQACHKSGLNFKNYANRQKFFDKTFAMMLCAVDPMYNKIEMYYHGLPAMSEFTFDQVKKNGKTESVDLMTMMKQYAQGMAPKF